MFRDVHVEGVGPVRLDEKNDYLAAGGEATVFVKGNTAYKIYHNPSRMIPVEKVRQLHAISDPKVIVPQKLIFDQNQQVIGFTLRFVPNTVPLVKFFSSKYKTDNNIGQVEMNKIVLSIQRSVASIHSAGCLIVDMNEMNILVDQNFDAWFIDTDSYKTRSHPATAIVEAIKDPLVTSNNFTQSSDWFAFGIITFQLFTGLHPFRHGKHPRYRPNQWRERMAARISVFDPQIVLPPSAQGFRFVPSNYLVWYKSMFINGQRSAPPNQDHISVVSMIIPATQVVNSTTSFDVTPLYEYPEAAKAMFSVFSGHYAITDSNVYVGNVNFTRNDGTIRAIINTKQGTPLIVKHTDKRFNIVARSGETIYTGIASDIMVRGGRLYAVQGASVSEVTFQELGNRVVGGVRRIAGVLPNATMFPGIIYQEILGKAHVSVPYAEGTCKTMQLPELTGKRVLHAKADKNVAIFVTEEKGQYDRYIFMFEKSFNNYSVRKVSDVDSDEPNFAVLPNGICALVSEDNVIELFVATNKATRVDNAPADNTTPIITLGNKICVIGGRLVKHISMKIHSMD